MIVATSGHVDHGKTELIKALTGINTDRLPEEKARGLTVDLGFAYETMPDGEILGFVDVPGHEKFIRNMLAGVAGIDLGLLVVAADDGVMPQTREHLAILSLLGISNILVALTKIDRIETGNLSKVYLEIKKFLGEKGFQEIAVYPVCAPKNIGIEALRKALHRSAKTIKSPAADGHFRMAIDRVFTLKGVGLVVTGMVFSGTVYNAETLTLLSDGSAVRVREIRIYNQVRSKAQAGERCALNIVGRGVGEKSLKRGAWLAHSNLNVPTKRIDVNLYVLATEENSLKHWTPVHLHVGSDHLPARVAILSAGSISPGKSGLAQLVLPRDTYVLSGDRFVLRDHSAQHTIAGGSVIDPFSPKRGRSRPGRITILNTKRKEKTAEILQALAEQSSTGVPLKPFSISYNLLDEQINTLIFSLGLLKFGTSPNERIFTGIRWHYLLELILSAISKFHKNKPKIVGASIKDIRLLLGIFLEEDILKTALKIMITEKRLGADGNRFYLNSHKIQISKREKIILERAAIVLAPNCGAPPSLHQAAKEIGVEVSKLEKTLKIGIQLGDFELVKKNRYVPSSLVVKLKLSAKKLAAVSTDGLFTTIKFREEVNMGRNFVTAVLEYFDQMGFTVRVGEHRRIKQPFSVVKKAEN